ncbi:glycoside hydrolase family 43 protein [soil metagenome]
MCGKLNIVLFIMKKISLVPIVILFLAAFTNDLAAQKTFTNPLLSSGADPWCIYKDGYYYYTNSLGNRIDVWKTKSIATLATAERKTVWLPPATGPYSKEIWAPEIHYLQGKWYIYFAADSGNNNGHRLWVLENSSADPLQGAFVMKGKLQTPEDKWSIDGSVFEYNNKMYLLWSGWEGDKNGQQNIYIAQMKNPWTTEGKRVLLSAPTNDWETHGKLNDPHNPPQVNVNEGPQTLEHDNRLFLIFSASGCWTDFYALGMLSLKKGVDVMDATAWTKSEQPVFKQSATAKVYATGHNSFFTSPDGKESYILYHANNMPGQGCGSFRSPRTQKFSWNADGTPNFGEPVAEKVALPVPAE